MGENKHETPSAKEAYNRYSDLLFRLSLSHLGIKEDAEDAVSEVFSKFINKTPFFNDQEHEKAWFIRVTINQCRDMERRRKIRRYTPIEQISQASTEVKDDLNDVLETLQRLPEKYKTVLILFYFEDFSIKDISSTLKITQAAVKMRLSRGRELFKIESEKGGDLYV